MVGVGDVAQGVGEGQLHRLDLQVVATRRVARQSRQVEALQDVQRRSARRCPGRWAGSPTRRSPGSWCEIGSTQVLVCAARSAAVITPPVCGGEVRRWPAAIARVEVVGVAIGEAAQGGGVVGAGATSRRRAGRVPAGGERLAPSPRTRRRCERGVDRHGAAPSRAATIGRDGIAVLGIVDGRLEQSGEGQLAKAGVQVAPGAGRAGHGHRPASPGCGIVV